MSCPGVDHYGGSFEIVVGNKHYRYTPTFAESLSRKIARIRESDPTTCQYVLKTSDPSSKFKDFIAFAFDSSVTITAEDFQFFVSVAHELENEELLWRLASAYFSVTEEITVSNAVTFLILKHIEGDDTSEEISFIASHFQEIEHLDSLDIHFLRRILSDKSLRISNEDSLYNFISHLIQKDPAFSDLLEFVRFEFLSTNCTKRFVNETRSLGFDFMNPAIWESICSRLCQRVIIPSTSLSEQEKRFGQQIIDDELENLSLELESERDEKEMLHHELSSIRRSMEMSLKSVMDERDAMKREFENVPMTICIKTIHNDEMKIKAKLSDRVEDIKAKIQNITGRMIDDQVLIYAGRLLDNQLTLADCSFWPNNAIHLVCRLTEEVQ